MAEFSLRNKAKNPIITLRPPVLQAMLAARPESASLVLGKNCRDYKRLTGKDVHLDHEQDLLLLQRCGAGADGSWTSPYAKAPLPWYAVERAFVDGFLARPTSGSLLDNLRIAEAFYSLLDHALRELGEPRNPDREQATTRRTSSGLEMNA